MVLEGSQAVLWGERKFTWMKARSSVYVFRALEVTLIRLIMKISVKYLCCHGQGKAVVDSCFCYHRVSTRARPVALNTEISKDLAEVDVEMWIFLFNFL